MRYKVGEYIRVMPYIDPVYPDCTDEIEAITPFPKHLEILNFKVIKDFNWDNEIEFSYMEIHDLVRGRYLKEPENAAFIPSKRAWMKCEE